MNIKTEKENRKTNLNSQNFYNINLKNPKNPVFLQNERKDEGFKQDESCKIKESESGKNFEGKKFSLEESELNCENLLIDSQKSDQDVAENTIQEDSEYEEEEEEEQKQNLKNKKRNESDGNLGYIYQLQFQHFSQNCTPRTELQKRERSRAQQKSEGNCQNQQFLSENHRKLSQKNNQKFQNKVYSPFNSGAKLNHYKNNLNTPLNKGFMRKLKFGEEDCQENSNSDRNIVIQQFVNEDDYDYENKVNDVLDSNLACNLNLNYENENEEQELNQQIKVQFKSELQSALQSIQNSDCKNNQIKTKENQILQKVNQTLQEEQEGGQENNQILGNEKQNYINDLTIQKSVSQDQLMNSESQKKQQQNVEKEEQNLKSSDQKNDKENFLDSQQSNDFQSLSSFSGGKNQPKYCEQTEKLRQMFQKNIQKNTPTQNDKILQMSHMFKDETTENQEKAKIIKPQYQENQDYNNDFNYIKQQSNDFNQAGNLFAKEVFQQGQENVNIQNVPNIFQQIDKCKKNKANQFSLFKKQRINDNSENYNPNQCQQSQFKQQQQQQFLNGFHENQNQISQNDQQKLNLNQQEKTQQNFQQIIKEQLQDHKDQFMLKQKELMLKKQMHQNQFQINNQLQLQYQNQGNFLEYNQDNQPIQQQGPLNELKQLYQYQQNFQNNYNNNQFPYQQQKVQNQWNFQNQYQNQQFNQQNGHNQLQQQQNQIKITPINDNRIRFDDLMETVQSRYQLTSENQNKFQKNCQEEINKKANEELLIKQQELAKQIKQFTEIQQLYHQQYQLQQQQQQQKISQSKKHIRQQSQQNKGFITIQDQQEINQQKQYDDIKDIDKNGQKLENQQKNTHDILNQYKKLYNSLENGDEQFQQIKNNQQKQKEIQEKVQQQLNVQIQQDSQQKEKEKKLVNDQTDQIFNEFSQNQDLNQKQPSQEQQQQQKEQLQQEQSINQQQQIFDKNQTNLETPYNIKCLKQIQEQWDKLGQKRKIPDLKSLSKGMKMEILAKFQQYCNDSNDLDLYMEDLEKLLEQYYIEQQKLKQPIKENDEQFEQINQKIQCIQEQQGQYKNNYEDDLDEMRKQLKLQELQQKKFEILQEIQKIENEENEISLQLKNKQEKKGQEQSLALQNLQREKNEEMINNQFLQNMQIEQQKNNKIDFQQNHPPSQIDKIFNNFQKESLKQTDKNSNQKCFYIDIEYYQKQFAKMFNSGQQKNDQKIEQKNDQQNEQRNGQKKGSFQNSPQIENKEQQQKQQIQQQQFQNLKGDITPIKNNQQFQLLEKVEIANLNSQRKMKDLQQELENQNRQKMEKQPVNCQGQQELEKKESGRNQVQIQDFFGHKPGVNQQVIWEEELKQVRILEDENKEEIDNILQFYNIKQANKEFEFREHMNFLKGKIKRYIEKYKQVYDIKGEMQIENSLKKFEKRYQNYKNMEKEAQYIQFQQNFQNQMQSFKNQNNQQTQFQNYNQAQNFDIFDNFVHFLENQNGNQLQTAYQNFQKINRQNEQLLNQNQLNIPNLNSRNNQIQYQQQNGQGQLYFNNRENIINPQYPIYQDQNNFQQQQNFFTQQHQFPKNQVDIVLNQNQNYYSNNQNLQQQNLQHQQQNQHQQLQNQHANNNQNFLHNNLNQNQINMYNQPQQFQNKQIYQNEDQIKHNILNKQEELINNINQNIYSARQQKQRQFANVLYDKNQDPLFQNQNQKNQLQNQLQYQQQNQQQNQQFTFEKNELNQQSKKNQKNNCQNLNQIQNQIYKEKPQKEVQVEKQQEQDQEQFQQEKEVDLKQEQEKQQQQKKTDEQNFQSKLVFEKILREINTSNFSADNQIQVNNIKQLFFINNYQKLSNNLSQENREKLDSIMKNIEKEQMVRELEEEFKFCYNIQDPDQAIKINYVINNQFLDLYQTQNFQLMQQVKAKNQEIEKLQEDLKKKDQEIQVFNKDVVEYNRRIDVTSENCRILRQHNRNIQKEVQKFSEYVWYFAGRYLKSKITKEELNNIKMALDLKFKSEHVSQEEIKNLQAIVQKTFDAIISKNDISKIESIIKQTSVKDIKDIKETNENLQQQREIQPFRESQIMLLDELKKQLGVSFVEILEPIRKSLYMKQYFDEYEFQFEFSKQNIRNDSSQEFKKAMDQKFQHIQKQNTEYLQKIKDMRESFYQSVNKIDAY